MPVHVPFIPPVQQQPTSPPEWLKLATGETYVRSYGSAAGAGQKQRINLTLAILLALGVALQIGFMVFGLGRKDVAAINPTSGSPNIMIAVVIAVIIVLGLIAMFAKRKPSGLEAVLTDRKMAFRVGGKVTGFELAEIVRLQPGGSIHDKGIQVFIKEYKEPAVTIPVENHEKDMAELTAFAKAAGAKLR